jgi:hypothetical protein
MTEEEKQREGFRTLIHACDALKAIVDRSELDPMTLKGVKVMGQVRDATLPPELAKHVFHAVLNTLREACVQGSEPSPILMPKRELVQ